VNDSLDGFKLIIESFWPIN